MIEYPCPIHQREGSPCVACVVSKSGDSAAGVIGQELKVKEGTTASWEARENGIPIRLAFIAVGKLDVCMVERNCESKFALVIAQSM